MSTMYSVSYVTGGWANMVCHTLTSLFTKEDAQKQVNELISMGYPAHAITCNDAAKQKGFFCNSEILEDEAEMKRHYKCYRNTFMGVNAVS